MNKFGGNRKKLKIIALNFFSSFSLFSFPFTLHLYFPSSVPATKIEP